ncbi:MAG: signal peptidase I [Terriglobales bacterium]
MASVISALLPGSGQLLLGMKRRGIWLLSGFLLVLIATCFLRLPKTYWGYIFTAWCMLPLGLYAACNALYGDSQKVPLRPSRWWLLAVVPAGVLLASITYAGLIRAAGFRAFTIPSTSMEPTLTPGDRFVVDARAYRNRDPKRGDIVAFRRDNIYFAKRVIAVPGDTIEGRYGSMFLDGQKLEEPYVIHKAPDFVPFELGTFPPITVSLGQYFVLGDNRDLSYDSRSRNFGPVTSDMILGRCVYIYWPSLKRRNLR